MSLAAGTSRPVGRFVKRALGIAAVTLILGEVAVRLVFSGRQFDTELIFANAPMERMDADLGWSLNPYVVQRVRTVDRDLVEYRTDDRGFRVDRAGGEPDVLFVGDSFTFGWAANRTFAAEFTRMSGVPSANAGVPGYGTDQAFLMTRRAIESLRLHPRVVVYGFFWNDVQNNVTDHRMHVDRVERVSKPIVAPATGDYLPPRLADNDVTGRYASPGLGQLLVDLGARSLLVRAVGRVIKYRLIEPPAPFVLGEEERRSLEANLDNFVKYLGDQQTRFVLLHIAAGPQPVEDQAGALLSQYSTRHGVTYLRTALGPGDLHQVDAHLSDQGATHVGEMLVNALR